MQPHVFPNCVREMLREWVTLISWLLILLSSLVTTNCDVYSLHICVCRQTISVLVNRCYGNSAFTLHLSFPFELLLPNIDFIIKWMNSNRLTAKRNIGLISCRMFCIQRTCIKSNQYAFVSNFVVVLVHLTLQSYQWHQSIASVWVTRNQSAC